MPHSWPRVRLGDHVDLLTGYPFKSAEFSDDPCDIRLVKGVTVGQGQLRWDRTDYWPMTDRSGYAKYELEVGDVILAMDRPWIEAGLKQAAVTERDLPALLLQRVARLRGVSGLTTGFLRYLISSQAFSDYIQPIVTGVNVPHISPDQIRGFTFNLPPESAQLGVAAVLMVYDELIENNLRRIEILEEMAQAVYREWFVNFRYPGHEGIETSDSALGPIPKGWSVAPIGDRYEVSLGGTPPRDQPELWHGDVPWVNSGAVNKLRVIEGVEYITEEAVQISNTKLWPAGATLIAITGATLGQVSLLGIESCANQSVVGVWDRSGDANQYIFRTIIDRIGALVSRAGGSAQQHINKGIISAFPVVVPPGSVIGEFTALIGPVNALVVNLLRQNANLRATRDLLLPRLVSGAIDVSDLDIDTEWLVA